MGSRCSPPSQRTGPLSRAEPRQLRRLVVLAGLLTGIAGTALALLDHRQDRWTMAAGFSALVLLGELLRVQLPGDRDTSPVGGAAAIGYSLLLVHGTGAPAHHGVANVIAVVFGASVAAALIHFLLDRDPRLPDMARRLLNVAVLAAVFRLFLVDRLDMVRVGENSRSPILAMLVAVLIGGAVDVVIAAGLRSSRERARFGPSLRNEIRAQSSIGTAMAATGILMALAVPIMDLWALLVFCVPLLVTQFSFRRYASISATYRQTIRALSRVTEVGGYVEPGHARRVMDLSVGIGREYGLSDADLLELEYAALMHDIGQLSLTEPIPRGSTLTVAPSERRRIAQLGAEVIRTTGNLDRVAYVVEYQANAYRKMRETADVDVPLHARIIKAASAYDDLVTASREQRGPRAAWDALERLRMGMAYEYDPRVVEALTRVLEKKGEL